MNDLFFCNFCVMDGSTSELVLDENGRCNFCHQAQKALKEIELEKPNLPKIIQKIKEDGQGRDYDILIGLSGGVDSSTALVKAVELGLRPMCFTMDNGYNDPKADSNILNLVEDLQVPLFRYVLDLDKFKELQSAYLRAGVINIEATYDHLLMAATYEMANKYGIKHILSGGNVATESIMPGDWAFNARDLTNLKDIYWKMSRKRLKNVPNHFPLCGILRWNYYHWVKKIRVFYLLDYIDYNRAESEKMLVDNYRFSTTGEKHEENVFTRWYQSFYLFNKYSVDKRKAHYSSLINSGQMTRDKARDLLAYSPVYPQLGIEDRVMKYHKQKHTDFKTDKCFDRISKVVRKIKIYGRHLRRLSNISN